MATATLYAASHITGTLDVPDNALGAPNGVWAGSANVNESWISEFALQAGPAGTPDGTHTITLRVRKGSNAGNPSISRCELRRNGVEITRLETPSSGSLIVSSTTGADVSFSFSGSLLTDLSNVSLNIETAGTGGKASNHNQVQLDAVTWVANYTAAANQYTGTGAITAAKPTASGSGLKTLTGSGNPTAPKSTASGTGTKLAAAVHSGSGSVTVPKPTAIGSGSRLLMHSGSGSVTASLATASGSGSRGYSGSGGATASPVSGTGAGAVMRTLTGSGAVAAAKANVTGSAGLGRGGSGTAAGTRAAATGAGNRGLGGSGSLSSLRPSITGSGALAGRNGTGSLTAPKPTGTGSGTVVAAVVAPTVLSGNGSTFAPKPTASGAGMMQRSGTGAVTASRAGAAGAGARGVRGLGAVTLAQPLLAGTGGRETGGFGQVLAGRPVGLGSGARALAGSGAGIAPISCAEGSNKPRKYRPPAVIEAPPMVAELDGAQRNANFDSMPRVAKLGTGPHTVKVLRNA